LVGSRVVLRVVSRVVPWAVLMVDSRVAQKAVPTAVLSVDSRVAQKADH